MLSCLNDKLRDTNSKKNGHSPTICWEKKHDELCYLHASDNQLIIQTHFRENTTVHVSTGHQSQLVKP